MIIGHRNYRSWRSYD